MAVFENFPYTNVHELNLDWIINEVKNYILKYEDLEKFVNSSIEEQNKIIENAIEKIENGMEELTSYIKENTQLIINELIESGQLYIGFTYNETDEEINIVLSEQEV